MEDRIRKFKSMIVKLKKEITENKKQREASECDHIQLSNELEMLKRGNDELKINVAELTREKGSLQQQVCSLVKCIVVVVVVCTA